VSDYFVLTAVLVEGSRLAAVQTAASRIIRAYFSSGELRSREVGSNVARGLRILGDLATLDLRHYSQVIDKSAVFTDSGLRFKNTFLTKVCSSWDLDIVDDKQHPALHTLLEKSRE